MTWLERRKWSEVESEMRREREKMGRWKKGWVERREDIREERGKKEKSIYICMARKLALLPPLGKKAGNFLWIAYLRTLLQAERGGRA